jgi:hypothetical protein
MKTKHPEREENPAGQSTFRYLVRNVAPLAGLGLLALALAPLAWAMNLRNRPEPRPEQESGQDTENS